MTDKKEIYMMTLDIFFLFFEWTEQRKQNVDQYTYMLVFIWRKRAVTTIKVRERKIKENNLYNQDKKNRITNPLNNTNGYFS